MTCKMSDCDSPRNNLNEQLKHFLVAVEYSDSDSSKSVEVYVSVFRMDSGVSQGGALDRRNWHSAC